MLNLLLKAKELNIPRQNLTSREDLQKSSKDTIVKYKEITFGVDSVICIEWLNKLQKQQIIDEIVHRRKLMEDTVSTAQKMKFSIKYFFSKCDQICGFLRIWSHLLKK